MVGLNKYYHVNEYCIHGCIDALGNSLSLGDSVLHVDEQLSLWKQT